MKRNIGVLLFYHNRKVLNNIVNINNAILKLLSIL